MQFAKNSKVNLFVVGAPKCGTTAICDYLAQHDAVHIPSIKEPHFFCSDFKDYRRISSGADYSRILEVPGSRHAIRGDASVWYLYSNTAAANIFDYNERAKVLICLRDPTTMLPSLHSQLVFSGRENVLSFEEAYDACSRRRGGNSMPQYVLEPRHLFYDEVCMYSEQVNRYISLFGSKNVKVILFEEFVANPKSEVKAIAEFLGITPDFNFSARRVNANKRHRFPKLARFLMRPPAPFRQIKQRVKSSSSGNMHQPMRIVYRLMSREFEREPLSLQMKDRIVSDYSDERLRIKRVLRVDSLPWAE